MTPSIKRNRIVAALAVAILLFVPLATMTSQTGAMSYYMGEGYPPGQSAYIMMRISGHLAYTLIFIQIVIGTLHGRIEKWLGIGNMVPIHRSLGLTAFFFALSHPIFFEWARQLRTGQSTVVATFWPPTNTGFYELHQFFGALGLYTLVAGVLAGVVGPRLAPKAWRTVHYINYGVFFLVWYHSFRIGSSTRIGFLPILYTVLATTVLVVVAWRLKTSLAPSPRTAPVPR